MYKLFKYIMYTDEYFEEYLLSNNICNRILRFISINFMDKVTSIFTFVKLITWLHSRTGLSKFDKALNKFFFQLL